MKRISCQSLGEAVYVIFISRNSVAFYGCLPDGLVGAAADSECLPGGGEAVADSQDPMEYRHFAVHDAADVAYYCDQRPYDDPDNEGLTGGRRRLHCFSLVENAGGERTWKGKKQSTNFGVCGKYVFFFFHKPSPPPWSTSKGTTPSKAASISGRGDTFAKETRAVEDGGEKKILSTLCSIDGNEAILSTLDGIRLDFSAGGDAGDLVPPIPVPGKTETDMEAPPLEWTGSRTEYVGELSRMDTRNVQARSDESANFLTPLNCHNFQY